MNNGGIENPTKKWVQKEFLNTIDEISNSIRWKRKGLYISYTFGKAN